MFIATNFNAVGQPITSQATAPILGLTHTLPFLSYIEGCDAEAEPHMELTYALGMHFNGVYAPEQLAQALRQLNPQVLLIAAAYDDGSYRSDFPALTDAALEELQLNMLNHAVLGLCNAVQELTKTAALA